VSHVRGLKNVPVRLKQIRAGCCEISVHHSIRNKNTYGLLTDANQRFRVRHLELFFWHALAFDVVKWEGDLQYVGPTFVQLTFA